MRPPTGPPCAAAAGVAAGPAAAAGLAAAAGAAAAAGLGVRPVPARLTGA
ncbi:hypothetical protein [Candidatus Mycolicibacterium alkanivorans]|uniref:Uncharacterized protein n=1 Tax=Candidatus Mycolicibacterium alkanivorans TaxID=2954114 RepID=A0ABS9Z0F3_9MYCO|nr:hypothetical protein [Candidatus Mycolicibacterium alkanivorans]MCI4676657.1 hypothetical protein [Candidatus Mycolicibacterium alkanivorans]